MVKVVDRVRNTYRIVKVDGEKVHLILSRLLCGEDDLTHLVTSEHIIDTRTAHMIDTRTAHIGI